MLNLLRTASVAAVLLILVNEGSAVKYPFRFGRSHDGFLGTKFVNTHGYLVSDDVENAQRLYQNDANTKVEIKYFTQKLDHFNTSETKTWKQLYWVNSAYFRPGGPAFVLLGGEGPTSQAWIDPSTNVTMTWMVFAEKYGAMAFQLEHRYYGKSYPTSDMSTENLRYLSSRQSLEDTANFIRSMKAGESSLEKAKWIVFGGSYSGMLSGWFRMLHPELVVGAVASSAPVQGQVDFREYLMVVANSLKSYSRQCLSSISEATSRIQFLFQTEDGRKFLEKKFRLCAPVDSSNRMDVSNFYGMFANIFSGAVQYSQDNRLFYATKYNILRVCERMANASLPDVLDRYASVNDLYMDTYGVKCQDTNYKNSVNDLRQTSWETEGKAGRLWYYQTCTEFGFYQGSDSALQPFGNAFPYSDSLQLCKDVFGFTAQSIKSAIDASNKFYGGRNGFNATNVVLTNGNVDPWHALGVLHSPNDRTPSILMADTAHVSDMYPAGPNDPPQLTHTREVIDFNINRWLSE